MFRRTYCAIAVSLLLTGLVGGCQSPLQLGGAQPRVVVAYGHMQLAPDADLSIALDVADLQRAYRTLAVGSEAITRISAKVSGEHLVEPLTTFVDVAACPGGQATLNFTNLPPGKVDVVVNAVDQAGQVVAYASNAEPVVIQPGKTALVELVCQTGMGGLKIDFKCEALCGGPSPSPTPTPEPIPTEPANPVKAKLLSSEIYSTIDPLGNIYILGLDPIDSPDFKDSRKQGRIIKVTPERRMLTTPVYDNSGAPSAAIGLADRLYFYNVTPWPNGFVTVANTNLLEPDHPIANVTSFAASFGWTAEGALALAKLKSAQGASTEMTILKGEPTEPQVLYSFTYKNPGGQTHRGFSPYSTLIFDRENRPYWGSDYGLSTLDAAGQPISLITDVPITLAAANEDASAFLYSGGRDGQASRVVYKYDRFTNQKVAVKDFGSNVHVSSIHFGKDGYHYICVQYWNRPPLTGFWDRELFSIGKYKLEKDGTGAWTLREVLMMVDTRGSF